MDVKQVRADGEDWIHPYHVADSCEYGIELRFP
jgi:hypothetical protein